MAEFHPVFLLLLGYLAGGIPTGYLVFKALKGRDIREFGSGNPGAANVYRTAGALAGGATLAVDAAKGWLPVWFALRAWPARPGLAVAAGAAAIAGHLWTPFLGFRGGKGVATSAGVFTALMPGPMLGVLLVFVVAVKLSGHISVGSLSAALALPALALAAGEPPVVDAAALGAGALVFLTHRPNIQRLLKHKELGIRGQA